MFEPRVQTCSSPIKINIKDSEVVFGHQMVQTRNIKWLRLDEIYQKFYRPNLYDIGGTHTQDVPDYWFSCKTEQVGNIFLLHLFVCNHDIASFKLLLSNSNHLNFDKKKGIVFMQKLIKEFQFSEMPKLSHNYLTTYSFTELDIACLKGKKLYIAMCIPLRSNDDVSLDIINNTKLKHDCSALLADPIGTDFTIESADGLKLNAHRVILSAHSEVFKAMLKEETAESQNSHVKLVDVSDEDLQCMIEFIYTGTVSDINSTKSANLLMLADRYNLHGLWELSEHVLSENIGPENVLDVLVIGDMYDSELLKSKAMNFIKTNQEILKSSAFKEIKNVNLVRELCTYLVS